LHYGIENDELSGQLFVDSGHDLLIKIATDSKSAVTIAEPLVEDIIEAL
jgi:hypothetical protein